MPCLTRVRCFRLYIMSVKMIKTGFSVEGSVEGKVKRVEG